jgi:pyruvate,water dikinase
LRQLVDDLADLAGDEVFYFFVVGGSAWKVESRLAAFYNRHLAGRIGGSHQELLQGLGQPSASDAHLALSLDWFHPTLGELGLTGDAEGGKRAEAARLREEAVRRATEALAGSPARARRFHTLLERAQHFGRVREEQAQRLTLAWPVLRRAVQRLAELAGIEDPYFLTGDELCSGVASSAASERRARWERQRRLSAPTWVGTMGFPQRLVFAGHGSHSEAGDVVRGAPASPGRVTGRVRVVLGVGSFEALQPGEILVAPATNPGWTPLFSRAAAVVTDTGSVMAHASLVAREYGIAAVVGTGNATRVLRDGDLVTVDGSAGTVERVT